MLVDIQEAQYLSRYKKRDKLLAVSHNLHTIKVLVRLTHSLDIISEKDYITHQSKLQEMGKMLGGWIKYIN